MTELREHVGGIKHGGLHRRSVRLATLPQQPDRTKLCHILPTATIATQSSQVCGTCCTHAPSCTCMGSRLKTMPVRFIDHPMHAHAHAVRVPPTVAPPALCSVPQAAWDPLELRPGCKLQAPRGCGDHGAHPLLGQLLKRTHPGAHVQQRRRLTQPCQAELVECANIPFVAGFDHVAAADRGLVQLPRIQQVRSPL